MRKWDTGTAVIVYIYWSLRVCSMSCGRCCIQFVGELNSKEAGAGRTEAVERGDEGEAASAVCMRSRKTVLTLWVSPTATGDEQRRRLFNNLHAGVIVPGRIPNTARKAPRLAISHKRHVLMGPGTARLNTRSVRSAQAGEMCRDPKGELTRQKGGSVF